MANSTLLDGPACGPLPPTQLPVGLREHGPVAANDVHAFAHVVKVSTTGKRQERLLVVTSAIALVCRHDMTVARAVPLQDVVLLQLQQRSQTEWMCAVVLREQADNPSVLLSLPYDTRNPDSDPLQPVKAMYQLSTRMRSGVPPAVRTVDKSVVMKASTREFKKPARYLSPQWLQEHAPQWTKGVSPQQQQTQRRSLTVHVLLRDADEPLGFTFEDPLLVTGVSAGGAAAAAGICSGDMIRAVDGSAVQDAVQLREAVGKARSGGRMGFDVDVLRSDRWRELAGVERLTVSCRPAGAGVRADPCSPADGIVVTSVEPLSAADHAGVTPGMVLLACGGAALADQSVLDAAIAGAAAAGAATLELEAQRPPTIHRLSLQAVEEPLGFEFAHEEREQGPCVVVRTVYPESPLGGASPAHRAGLTSGVLCAVAGRDVRTADDLRETVAAAREAGLTELEIAVLPDPEEEYHDTSDRTSARLSERVSDRRMSVPSHHDSPILLTPRSGDWLGAARSMPQVHAQHSSQQGTCLGFGEPRSVRLRLYDPQQQAGILCQRREGPGMPLRVVSVAPGSPAGIAGLPRGYLTEVDGEKVSVFTDVGAIIRRRWAEAHDTGPVEVSLTVEPWLGDGEVPSGDDVADVRADRHVVRFLLWEGQLQEYVNWVPVGVATRLSWDPANGVLTDQRGAGTAVKQGRAVALRRLAVLADRAGVLHNLHEAAPAQGTELPAGWRVGDAVAARDSAAGRPAGDPGKLTDTGEGGDVLVLWAGDDEPTAVPLSALVKVRRADRAHHGAWRGPERAQWCSTTAHPDGPVCRHGTVTVVRPHWSCCGRTARDTDCNAAELDAVAEEQRGAERRQRHRDRRRAAADKEATLLAELAVARRDGRWERRFRQRERRCCEEEVRWHREQAELSDRAREWEAAGARRAAAAASEMESLQREASRLREREARLDEQGKAVAAREAAVTSVRRSLDALSRSEDFQRVAADLSAVADAGAATSAAEEVAAELHRALQPAADEQRVFAALRCVRGAGEWRMVVDAHAKMYGSCLLAALKSGLTPAELRAATDMLTAAASADLTARRIAAARVRPRALRARLY